MVNMVDILELGDHWLRLAPPGLEDVLPRSEGPESPREALEVWGTTR